MEDKEAIKSVVMDYVEGWYSADGSRMENALFENLVKRRITPEGEIWGVDKPWMVTETGNGRGSIDNPESGKKEFTILDQKEFMASVKLVSNDFTDYLHLSKINGKWKIVHALWDY